MADRSPAVLRLAAVLVAAGLGLQTLPALAQTGRSAGRPTVSVPNFKNTVTQQAWWWQGPVAEDLAAMLANELAAEGDLQVVERSNLKDVLSEQELTDLGIVRQSPNAAQRGQMTGARYIVLGTVSSYDSNVENTSSGSNFGLLGFGTKKQQVETKDYVAIDIRVVDSTTGEVVGRRTVEGRATSTAEAREQGGSLLPLAAGALLLPLLPGDGTDPRGPRTVALVVLLADLLLMLWVFSQRFDGGSSALQLVERVPWVPFLGLEWSLAADGLSAPLVVLSGLVTLLAVAASCGPRALGLACDLTDPDQVNAALASICARFGGLDVVVSNAGAAWTGAIAELAAAELRASFELNSLPIKPLPKRRWPSFAPRASAASCCST